MIPSAAVFGAMSDLLLPLASVRLSLFSISYAAYGRGLITISLPMRLPVETLSAVGYNCRIGLDLNQEAARRQFIFFFCLQRHNSTCRQHHRPTECSEAGHISELCVCQSSDIDIINTNRPIFVK
jgi:hypothetical protein